MNNPRITAREWGLLKGAIRRVFSRSELRRSVIDAAIIPGHIDETRPKVKTWCRCAECGKPEAKSYLQVDHKIPIVPLDKAFADMSLDELVDRVWCDKKNLTALDKLCHSKKTKSENKERRRIKKEKKDGK